VKFNSAKKKTENRVPAAPGIGVNYQPGTGYVSLDVDPENQLVGNAVKNAAGVYLKKHREAHGPDAEPSEDAQRLFGIVKHPQTGEWHHDPAYAAIRHTNTLADYMELPLVSKTWGRHPNAPKNVVLGNGIRTPSMPVGYDENGEGVMAGSYKWSNGKKDLAKPLELIGTADALRRHAYRDLVNKGVTDKGKYWDRLKGLTHLVHGRKVTDKDPLPENETERGSWHSLGENGEPMHLHLHVQHVVHNMANNYDIDEQRLPKGPDGLDDQDALEHAKNMLDDARTSRFTMCNCPHCAINLSTEPASSVWDTQHHDAAASSKDPLVREAYFHENSFPMGKDDQIGKMSDLGEVGKRCHHRIFWSNNDGSYVNGNKDRRVYNESQELINHMVKMHREAGEHQQNTPPTMLHPFTGRPIEDELGLSALAEGVLD